MAMKIQKRQDLKVTTQTCHASTIAFYKDEPVFAWFGGYKEGSIDCSIYVQYKDKIWNVGYNTPYAMWNPILFLVDDKLFLFVKKGEFCDRWQTYLYDISGIDVPKFDIERDVIPVILPAGLNGPVKTKPVIYNNEIYCGSSVETRFNWSAYIESYDKNWNYIYRSEPLTASLAASSTPILNSYGIPVAIGLIQPTLWLDKFNQLNAFFRSSHGLNKIYHSSCQGNSLVPDHFHSDWTKPVPTALNNPNSGMDVVYHKERLFLAYNPDASRRFPLVVAELDVNFDVINEVTIEKTPDNYCYSPEFSYPYLIEHDDLLHLTYTHCRTGIKHCIIDPE